MIATVRKRMPLLALFSVAILSPPLYAADGSINVTGRVVENACLVAADSKNITVDFGVQAGNSGFSAAIYPAFINLLDCPSGAKQVKIRFEGTGDGWYVFAPDNQGQPGAAQNVGFGIHNADDHSGIEVNGESKPYELKNSGSGSANELQFGVSLRWLNDKSQSQPIPLGEAMSTIQFSILYN
ncbi:long polar fimbrial protein LpfA [Serratia marcescens]|nr:long polar fimbrial protein LpfA [Serratia marcescens]